MSSAREVKRNAVYIAQPGKKRARKIIANSRGSGRSAPSTQERLYRANVEAMVLEKKRRKELHRSPLGHQHDYQDVDIGYDGDANYEDVFTGNELTREEVLRQRAHHKRIRDMGSVEVELPVQDEPTQGEFDKENWENSLHIHAQALHDPSQILRQLCTDPNCKPLFQEVTLIGLGIFQRNMFSIVFANI